MLQLFEAVARAMPSVRLGSCVSKAGETPLIAAAAAGYADVCEWLLAATGMAVSVWMGLGLSLLASSAMR